MTQRWLDGLKMDVHQQLICSATLSKPNHSQHMAPSSLPSFSFSTECWQGKGATLISVLPPMRNGLSVSFVSSTPPAFRLIALGDVPLHAAALWPQRSVGFVCRQEAARCDSNCVCVCCAAQCKCVKGLQRAARWHRNERFAIHEKLPRRFDVFSRQSVCVWADAPTCICSAGNSSCCWQRGCSGLLSPHVETQLAAWSSAVVAQVHNKINQRTQLQGCMFCIHRCYCQHFGCNSW